MTLKIGDTAPLNYRIVRVLRWFNELAWYSRERSGERGNGTRNWAEAGTHCFRRVKLPLENPRFRPFTSAKISEFSRRKIFFHTVSLAF